MRFRYLLALRFAVAVLSLSSVAYLSFILFADFYSPYYPFVDHHLVVGAWAPDSSKLVYQNTIYRDNNGTLQCIYVLNMVNFDPWKVTCLDWNSSSDIVAWSPDSKYLVYLEGSSLSLGHSYFNIIGADGHGRHRLVACPSYCRSLVWSPDQSAIGYQTVKDVQFPRCIGDCDLGFYAVLDLKTMQITEYQDVKPPWYSYHFRSTEDQPYTNMSPDGELTALIDEEDIRIVNVQTQEVLFNLDAHSVFRETLFNLTLFQAEVLLVASSLLATLFSISLYRQAAIRSSMKAIFLICAIVFLAGFCSYYVVAFLPE